MEWVFPFFHHAVGSLSYNFQPYWLEFPAMSLFFTRSTLQALASCFNKSKRSFQAISNWEVCCCWCHLCPREIVHFSVIHVIIREMTQGLRILIAGAISFYYGFSRDVFTKCDYVFNLTIFGHFWQKELTLNPLSFFCKNYDSEIFSFFAKSICIRIVLSQLVLALLR